jgi:hypothetical protein
MTTKPEERRNVGDPKETAAIEISHGGDKPEIATREAEDQLK